MGRHRMEQLSLWQIVVLAVLQGATEFLPVSSSGHLVIAAAFLTSEGSTAGLDIGELNIVLHGGTLLSILVYYWRRIWRLVGQDRRTLGLLVLGTIPAVVIGVPLKKLAGDTVLANPLLAGALLPVTGLFLLLAQGKPGSDRYQDLSYGKTFLIGLSQAIAILPGLSRSGATITAGSRLGLSPDSAATFSFLLAIPAIGGACVLQALSGIGQVATPWWHLLIGAGVAFAAGLVSLVWLIHWIQRGRLHYFAWWCIPVGILVVIWQLATISG